MKPKKIIIALVFALSLGMAFAYTKIDTILSTTSSSSTQTTTPNQEILGIWHLEDSPSDTFEYLTNGVKNTYSNGELVNSSFYEIGNTCNSTPSSNPDDKFLKEVDDDGFEHCYFINGINENGSNVLSLMDDRGKIIRLER